MYPILVTISLILVFGSSAFMSVAGLLSVFSSSPAVIIPMGLGMEIGKILTVSHLFRNWIRIWYRDSHIVHRYYFNSHTADCV